MFTPVRKISLFLEVDNQSGNGTESAILSNDEEKMKPKGFTLIELLISFAIVVILVIGAAQLTIHSLLVKRRSDLSMTSADMASSKLEYLKGLPYESDELREGFSTDRFLDDRSDEYYQRKWQIKNVSPHLKRIEMECFPESYPRKGVRLVLFCSMELDF